MPTPEEISNSYEKKNLQIIARNAKKIKALYEGSIVEISLTAATVTLKEGTFALDKYPRLKAVVERELQKLHGGIYATVVNSIKESWDLSNEKNNLLVDKRLAGKKPTKKGREILYDPNKGALEQFLKRKEKGLDLSKRVWNSLDPFPDMLEGGLAIGISEGKSAAELARDLRSYLNEPDRLFRRVRAIKGDPNSKLVLSKAAREFHPGQGVYRSAFKNSLRLTATETSMSYQTADHERWKKLGFVIGIKVSTSNNHPEYDICDAMAGLFPADYHFTSWHPNCRCHATAIQMSDDDYDKYEDSILNGTTPPEVKRIDKIHDGAISWIKENAERISGWKNTPYFLKNNPQYLGKYFK